MRLLICGDRNWTYKSTIKRQVEILMKDHDISVIIIRGDRRGGDRLAGEVAEELGIPLSKFPGTTNQQFLDESKPDYVLAFSEDIKNESN